MSVNAKNSSLPMPDEDEWRKYKFPRYEVQRRGHEGTLREMVDDMKLKSPGRFDDFLQSAETTELPPFITTAPPDVTLNTRILAVLTVPDYRVSPDTDGCFISDFFAFMHLFKGRTQSPQTWMYDLDMKKVLNENPRYLYGSPFKIRKVVFDEKIYKQHQKSYHPLSHQTHLKGKTGILQERFRDKLKNDIDQARNNDEKVLVLLFGHGLETSVDFNHGDRGSTVREVPDIKSMVISLVEREAKDVDIMLASPSFYRGGWVYHPITLSATSAAMRKQECGISSKHCPSSRIMASAFTHSLKDKMTNKIEDDDEASDYEEMEEEEVDRYMELQWKSNSDLRSYIHNILVTYDIDDRIMHEFTFSAQDDNWWRPRTGFSLDELEKRWNTLEDWDRDESFHQGDIRNSDPMITPEQRREFDVLFKQYRNFEAERQKKLSEREYHAKNAVLGKRTLSAFELRGGSIKTLRSRADSMYKMYRQNYPMFDVEATNFHIMSTLHDLDALGAWWPRLDWRAENLVLEANDGLDYRLSQIFMADRYLDTLGMRFPKGKTCAEFMEWKQRSIFSDERKAERDVISKVLSPLGFYVLFPEHAPPGPRMCHNKGSAFMWAAIYSSDLRLCVLKSRLEAIVKSVDQSVTDISKAMKRYPEVEAKREKIARAFRKTMRDVSPTRSPEQVTRAGSPA